MLALSWLYFIGSFVQASFYRPNFHPFHSPIGCSHATQQQSRVLNSCESQTTRLGQGSNTLVSNLPNAPSSRPEDAESDLLPDEGVLLPHWLRPIIKLAKEKKKKAQEAPSSASSDALHKSDNQSLVGQTSIFFEASSSTNGNLQNYGTSRCSSQPWDQSYPSSLAISHFGNMPNSFKTFHSSSKDQEDAQASKLPPSNTSIKPVSSEFPPNSPQTRERFKEFYLPPSNIGDKLIIPLETPQNKQKFAASKLSHSNTNNQPIFINSLLKSPQNTEDFTACQLFTLSKNNEPVFWKSTPNSLHSEESNPFVPHTSNETWLKATDNKPAASNLPTSNTYSELLLEVPRSKRLNSQASNLPTSNAYNQLISSETSHIESSQRSTSQASDWLVSNDYNEPNALEMLYSKRHKSNAAQPNFLKFPQPVYLKGHNYDSTKLPERGISNDKELQTALHEKEYDTATENYLINYAMAMQQLKDNQLARQINELKSDFVSLSQKLRRKAFVAENKLGAVPFAVAAAWSQMEEIISITEEFANVKDLNQCKIEALGIWQCFLKCVFKDKATLTEVPQIARVHDASLTLERLRISMKSCKPDRKRGWNSAAWKLTEIWMEQAFPDAYRNHAQEDLDRLPTKFKHKIMMGLKERIPESSGGNVVLLDHVFPFFDYNFEMKLYEAAQQKKRERLYQQKETEQKLIQNSKINSTFKF